MIGECFGCHRRTRVRWSWLVVESMAGTHLAEQLEALCVECR